MWSLPQFPANLVTFLVQLNDSFWILNSIILSFNLHSICSLPIQYVQTFISSSKLWITNLCRWFIACAIVLLYHLPFPFIFTAKFYLLFYENNDIFKLRGVPYENYQFILFSLFSPNILFCFLTSITEIETECSWWCVHWTFNLSL